MRQAHLGVVIRRPPRRGMSRRLKTEIWHSFERWGWDEKGWATTTRYRYVRRAKVADEWLQANHKVYLMWATHEQVRDYLFSTPQDAGNRNDIRSALIGFGNFCVSRAWRPDNPSLGLPRLPVPKPLPKALSVEQGRRIVALAEQLQPMDRALVLLYLYGGVRRSEAMMLEWRNVSPGWITVTGKGNKDRDVALHPVAEDALMAWRLQCRDPRWCFPSPRSNGRPVSRDYIRLLVKELGEMCGIPELHPHLFRHTHATRLLETGSDLRDVQVALGHASPATTAIYTRIRPARVQEAVGRLDFSGPTPVVEVAPGNLS